MGLFDCFKQMLGDRQTSHSGSDLQVPFAINPARGLPMVGGQAGVDVAGNPFGIDLHRRHDDYWGRQNHRDMRSFDSDARWYEACSSEISGDVHDPWRH